MPSFTRAPRAPARPRPTAPASLPSAATTSGTSGRCAERLDRRRERDARRAQRAAPPRRATPPPTTTTSGSRTFTRPGDPLAEPPAHAREDAARHGVAGPRRLGHERPAHLGRVPAAPPRDHRLRDAGWRRHGPPRVSACPLATCSQQPWFPQPQSGPAGSTMMWPISAANPWAPRSSVPSTMMPPPIPVPDPHEQHVAVAAGGAVPVLAPGRDVVVVVRERRQPDRVPEMVGRAARSARRGWARRSAARSRPPPVPPPLPRSRGPRATGPHARPPPWCPGWPACRRRAWPGPHARGSRPSALTRRAAVFVPPTSMPIACAVGVLTPARSPDVDLLQVRRGAFAGELLRPGAHDGLHREHELPAGDEQVLDHVRTSSAGRR